jgi:hypothetical protein
MKMTKMKNEKQKKYDHEYQIKNKERIAEYKRLYYQAHKEEYKARARVWRNNLPEERLKELYAQNLEWQRQHRKELNKKQNERRWKISGKPKKRRWKSATRKRLSK